MFQHPAALNTKTIAKALGTVVVGFALMFHSLASHGQNLLADPGFEHQTPAADGGWNLFGGAAYSNAYARTGEWSMFVPAFFGVSGTFEQFPAAPGSKWQLTGFGMTPVPIYGSPAFGIVQVSFFDVFGNDLGTMETAGSGTNAKVSNHVDSLATPGQWIALDTGTATAPAGTAYIQAFTLMVDFTGLYQGVYFDDLSLRVLVANHGKYVSSIAHNAQALLDAGLITADQKDAMVRAAARSGGGKK